MIETIQLNGKPIQVKPITFGEISSTAVKIAQAVEGMAAIQKSFYRYIKAVQENKGVGKVEQGIMSDVVAAFPDLVQTALSAIWKVPIKEIQAADALEVMEGIEVTMKVIRFEELLAQGKKLMGPLAPAAPRPQAPSAAAAPAPVKNRKMRRQK